ncbi:MAG: peptidoglycan-associated lipoprotein Pal [Rickettsiaceae bacterium]
MIKKVAAALFAIALLSGCSSSAGKYGSNNKYIAEFERTVGDRVFFALDRSNISSEAQSTLMRQAGWLNEHSSFNVTVEGHCDERGTRDYNIGLGERRANAVKNFLVQNGVSADRIETISYGKERPAVIGNTEEAFSKNRRGVTVIK